MRAFVVIQAFDLLVVALGLPFFCLGIVQNNLEWKMIGLIFFLLGMIWYVIMATGGFARLIEANFLPTSIRIYALVGKLFFLILLLSIYLFLRIFFAILLIVFPFYGIIPQFIARWLAKEAEKGTL